MDYHGCNDLADHLRYVSPSINGDVPVVTAWYVEAVCKESLGVFCSVALVLKRGRSMITVTRRGMGGIQIGNVHCTG